MASKSQPKQKIAYKIITAGDGGVGKTTLLHRYIEGQFLVDTKMTIGVGFFQKDIILDDIFSGDYKKLFEKVGEKKASEISTEVAAGKIANQNVRLYSCSAGLYSKALGKNLAQELSNKLGLYVIAATVNGTCMERPLPDDNFYGIAQSDPNNGYVYIDPDKGSWVLFSPGGDETQEKPYRVLGRDQNDKPITLNVRGAFGKNQPWIDICTEHAEKLIAEDKEKNLQKKRIAGNTTS